MPLKNAFWLSLALCSLKLFGFYVSGSMIVLASFYDSITDSLMSYLNYVFYNKAREKADHRHPFGHAGFEVLSGLLQGIMISVFGLILAHQSILQLLGHQDDRFDPKALPISIGIMLLSAGAGFGIQWYLGIFEKKLKSKGEMSLTLSSDRAHYHSDFTTNLVGAIGLFTVLFTGSRSLDSVLGLAGAVLLLKTAWPLLQNSLAHIMQVGIEPELQQEILALVLSTDATIEGLHLFRARRMGQCLFIDFHMKLPASLALAEAHELGERVEEAIKQRYPHADVLIHLDPNNLLDEEEI
ncbi:MAG: cation diffusion facilitator family transporter [Proteobacteria bacterium]|nr:cation diffusion facilitator family transporter [Pseudomonadota bacterium]